VIGFYQDFVKIHTSVAQGNWRIEVDPKSQPLLHEMQCYKIPCQYSECDTEWVDGNKVQITKTTHEPEDGIGWSSITQTTYDRSETDAKPIETKVSYYDGKGQLEMEGKYLYC
jgi:hypothetical protein